MCKQTIYNLRLSNIAPNNTNLVSLSSDKSEYSVKIPAWLRSKGKCNITVQNVIIQTKNGTGTSVVPANAHTAVVEVDGLNLLGFSNQNGSQALTLCEIPIDSNQNDITLVNPYTFTSLNIESSVTIKRKCYNPTNENISVSLNNNKIKFKEAAGNFAELTIATGAYSLAELLTTLKTMLDAASANTYTYTLTQHPVNGRITITNSGNSAVFDFSGTNTCRLFLGFSQTTHTISTAAGITSDIPLDILDSFLPIPMAEYSDIVVPMVVNLSLEFDED